MARKLVSGLTLVLALTSSVAFIGCAEEPKPETPPATTPAETPKDKEAATPPADAEKPAEAPK